MAVDAQSRRVRHPVGFDPGRVSGAHASDTWRGFATAVRLGWAVEANWADPLLFFIYSVAKPIAAALMLVVMLEIISGGEAGDYRAFLVIGTALWAIVQGGLAGLALSVLDDRERYRMLKYVYVSPTSFMLALLGRGVARIAIGAIGATLTLMFGVAFLGVAIDVGAVNLPLLLVSSAMGVASIVALGLALAAVVLQTRQESWTYPEAMAGALFLVVGAVFPLSALPAPAQAIGLSLPMTWWMEGIRRALISDGTSAIGGSGSLYAALTGRSTPEAPEIVVALLVTGALSTLAAVVAFRVSERRAKDRGLIDQTTGT